MRKAMENVEKHYAVVGVLEDLNKTLTVLEHYIPRFFKGAKDVYYSKCILSHIPVIFLRFSQFKLPCKNHRSYLILTYLILSDQIQKFSKINRNIYKPPVAEDVKVFLVDIFLLFPLIFLQILFFL